MKKHSDAKEKKNNEVLCQLKFLTCGVELGHEQVLQNMNQVVSVSLIKSKMIQSFSESESGKPAADEGLFPLHASAQRKQP